MVKAKVFREDLFYRLNVLSIHVPPLRERKDDIVPLVEHFLKKHRALSPDRTFEAEREFVEALRQIQLSGNIRQLENLVRWVLVNKEDARPLSLRDLPSQVLEELADDGCNESLSAPEQTDRPREVDAVSDGRDIQIQLKRLLICDRRSLSQYLQFCEKAFIEAALTMTKGNQARAAQVLGITPRTVYNLIRRHELSSH